MTNSSWQYTHQLIHTNSLFDEPRMLRRIGGWLQVVVTYSQKPFNQLLLLLSSSVRSPNKVIATQKHRRGTGQDRTVSMSTVKLASNFSYLLRTNPALEMKSLNLHSDVNLKPQRRVRPSDGRVPNLPLSATHHCKTEHLSFCPGSRGKGTIYE